MSKTFQPTDATKELLAKSWGVHGEVLHEKSIEFFFKLWSTEDDPRKAASLFANFYLRQAALIAVLGAECASQPFSRQLWDRACGAEFERAVKHVHEKLLPALEKFKMSNFEGDQ